MGRHSDYTEELAEVDIYALCSPETGEIRYIGKANNALKRLGGHLRDARRRDTPVYRWIRKLQSRGLSPKLLILLSVGPEKWEAAEVAAISRAKTLGIRLLNVSKGGDQPFCALDVRSRNGKANAGAMRAASRPVRKILNSMGHQIKFFRERPEIPNSLAVIAKIISTMNKLSSVHAMAKERGIAAELDAALVERFSCAT